MKQIMVYFCNGCKAPFDRDNVAFKDRDGTYFTLSDNFLGEENFSKLVDDGRAFINFDNVCYVQEIKELGDYEED